MGLPKVLGSPYCLYMYLSRRYTLFYYVHVQTVGKVAPISDWRCLTSQAREGSRMLEERPRCARTRRTGAVVALSLSDSNHCDGARVGAAGAQRPEPVHTVLNETATR